MVGDDRSFPFPSLLPIFSPPAANLLAAGYSVHVLLALICFFTDFLEINSVMIYTGPMFTIFHQMVGIWS